MAVTLQEIENRLVTLEREVALLQQQVSRNGDEGPAARGVRLLSQSEKVHQSLACGWDKFLERLGAPDQSLKPEKVQEAARAAGLCFVDNELSRALIDMREE